MDLKKARQVEIKTRRADARRLTLVARHLRERASEIQAEIRAEEKAEKARTNFFSKPAQVDSGLVLTPELPKQEGELFPERRQE